ncbi:MAG: polymer-forming cytoskeletal protein [Gemmobacter sp.]|jgi:cytoskeletal protein CcmA (bactofilin family)|nr:polymer-forming cytoskeletal protein [Gemmobacter sp.]
MTLPAESSRAAASGGRSVIAQDVRITGDIGSEGIVDLAGEIEGNVTARTVVISPGGRLKGTIMAETVDLRGTVEGRISCLSLTLRATAQVMADASYQTLAIENGAAIEGSFTRPSYTGQPDEHPETGS